MIFKPHRNLNYLMCEEESCQEDSTRIWANKESRIIDLCDLHYNQLVKDSWE